MYIYDTSKRKKVKFEPVSPMKANIYLCGPTVYDDAHLGHAKSAVSFDLLRRTLTALGYEVNFARNYTDIDDKILKKMDETGESLEAITQRYIQSYERDMKALGVLDPNFKPKATQCLEAIKEYIVSLLKSVASNDGKKDVKDFALWKFDEKWYDSPFGRGRPGWHTECVAMIKQLFSASGDENFNIDIHAGGIDLLFPHHENEAAQCRCAERKSLAKYWMHNGFIQVNNEKMSKSLGNSFFVKDALRENLGEALRYYLLTSHYRANFNYSSEDLSAAKKRLDKIYRLKKRVLGVSASAADKNFKREILEALSDDLNASKALAAVDEFIKNANDGLDNAPKDKALKGSIAANLEFIAQILGVGAMDCFEYFQFGVTDEQRAKISRLISERDEAKKAKDYAKSDAIRDELAALGISIMDTPCGCMWEKI